MDSEFFVDSNINKLILRCAIPAVITSVFGALYAVVDGMFVGKYIGENALASINLIMPIIMIVESFSNMIATGASVNISMLLGAKNRNSASRVFSSSIIVIILISCVIGICGFFFAKPFVRLIAPGATEEATLMAVTYLKIYALFSPLIPIYFAMDNFLRVCGKPKMSMIVGISSQLMNVILDYLLIVVLKQGILAAALGSCISITLASAFMLLYFMGSKRDVFYTFELIPLKSFAHIIGNGFSEFFSNISMSVMSVVMNLFLLKYGGTTAIAAFSIVMYVDSIIGMVNFGICDSIQPAISYCYGANMYERMKKIYRRIVEIVMAVSIIAFLFMFLAGPNVARLFISDSDNNLRLVSYKAIKLFAFSYLFGWIDMCFSSFFTAIDKPLQSFVISFFGTLVFPILFLFVLTSVWGLNGVWIMASVASAASGILTFVLVKLHYWKLERKGV